MTGLLLLVCSVTLARQLQTHYHHNWSLNMEPGDRTVTVVNPADDKALDHHQQQFQ